jgi:TIR domain-containing protein
MTRGALRLGRHRQSWLAAAAAGLAAAASALTTPPPVLLDSEGVTRSIFAGLVSAAIVALTFLPSIVYRGVHRQRMWTAIAIATLALGVGSFAASGYAQRTCTTRYAGKPIVIGTELTPLGAAYKQSHPELSSDDLLFDAAGAPDRLWTRASIDRCRTLISTSYFLWIPFLVACLLAVVQALPSTILPPAMQEQVAPVTPAETSLRYDVFISYRHQQPDASVARRLVEALETDGYRVAIDERDFPANASFLLEMERAVRESRFTVAIISSRYLQSGNTEEEAIITKVLDMGDRKRRLIPLIIESVSLPAWMYGIVGIDCTRPDPLVDPFDKLKATIGQPLGRREDKRA